TGTLLGSVTLTGPGGSAWFGNPTDIDVASDGTLAVGTWSGHVVQMTSAFTGITYFQTWSSGGSQNACFVTFTNAAPPPPSISIGNYTANEGNSSTTTFTFTVTLSAASSQTVTVNYATADATATAGSDHVAAGGTATFTPGQTSQNVTVSVTGDTTDEPDETFYVNLSSPTNATLATSQGRGTILNDDLTLSVNDVSVVEGNSGTTPATFTVSLSAASSHSVTVGYYTSGGTPPAGSDYTSVNGTLTFNPGQTTATVTVPVVGDTT